MRASPSAPEKDPIRPWFEALDALGDYTTFKFGCVSRGGMVRWHERDHSQFDGVGGFADILQEAGVELPPLPQNNHRTQASWWPFFRALPALLGPRRRLRWAHMAAARAHYGETLPDPVLAWHVFERKQSEALREAARRQNVTLNSYLLKHLDASIRADLEDPGASVPWMLPVNLRGKVPCSRETENQSSYLAIRISPSQSVEDLHRDIHRRLDRGEHWAAWKAYSATRLLPMSLKKLALRTDRATTQWNLGLFTNLGDWDREGNIEHPDYLGPWIVRATVLRSQMVGAACMTFQGRLSLTIQIHPDLTTSELVPRRWLDEWIGRACEALPASSSSQQTPGNECPSPANQLDLIKEPKCIPR